MTTRERYAPRHQNERKTVPFANAAEAWFWFIQAQAAANDGARASGGLVPRPCEPLDILKILDRLVRHRCLVRDHLIVMRHYGRRLMPPDPRRAHEARADRIWREAMGFLEEAMLRKGFILKTSQPFWREERAYEFAD